MLLILTQQKYVKTLYVATYIMIIFSFHLDDNFKIL